MIAAQDNDQNFVDKYFIQIEKFFEKPSTTIIIGPMGSGKTTQALQLMNFLKSQDPFKRKVFLVETRKIYQRWLGKKDANREYIKNIISNFAKDNHMLPPAFVAKLWFGHLEKRYTSNEHVIIEGSPRSEHEAYLLMDILSDQLFCVPKPINLITFHNIHMDTAIARLKKRDGEKFIESKEKERELIIYTEQATNVHFWIAGKKEISSHAVDASGTVEEVYLEMQKKILGI